MTCQQGTDFLKGALVGGLIAGVAGLLIAPKSGHELREDFAEGYNTVRKKTQDIKDDLISRGRNLIGHEDVEAELDDEGFLHANSSVMVGVLAGSVIGALAALLLAPDSGTALRKKLGSHYDEIIEKAEEFVSGAGEKGREAMDQVEDWKETLSTIVSKLASKGKKQANSQINEIMDWASLGLKVFQQLQRRS